MRSETIGLRLCGIADEPFWPLPNGSSTSRTSVRARCRSSSANRSSEAASSASAFSTSAWRSRWRICVELGAGSSPSRSQAIRSTSGSAAEYVPTAPESLPTRIPSSARDDARAVALERERPAGELEPERRRLGVDAVRAPDRDRVAMLLRPGDDGGERPLDAVEHERARFADLQRERGVEHVRRGQAVVEPAALLAELLRDRVDERGDVVVRSRLDLRHALGRRRRPPAPGSRRPPRAGRPRSRPTRRAPPARRRASGAASPRPTRSPTWPGGSSAKSLERV